SETLARPVCRGCTRRSLPSDRRVENFRTLALRRRPVRVHEQVDLAVVRCLERRPGLDVDESSGRDVFALRWIAEVHGQRSGEHDEGLLLGRVPVAAALRARFVAPKIRARVGEAGPLAELRNTARGLVGLVWTLDPLELV